MEVSAMNIKTRTLVIGAVAVVGIVAVVTRASRLQFGSRYTSPPANVATTITGKQISIEYYAPSMHGRKVMGGLVSFGEVWCTGANWATDRKSIRLNSSHGSISY